MKLVCSGQPYSLAYQQINAYRNRNQNGLITGTTSTSGSWTKYEFSDSSGIKELYVSTDYCQNTLNNFIIKSITAGGGTTVSIKSGRMTSVGYSNNIDSLVINFTSSDDPTFRLTKAVIDVGSSGWVITNHRHVLDANPILIQ